MENRKTMRGVAFAARETVRIAFAGTGGRGRSLLNDVLHVPNTQIVALYDPSEEARNKAATQITNAKQAPPRSYESYAQLLQETECDLVYVASPWEHHVPMAVAAMEAGKHVAVEVPAATTIEECWQLVTTSERTRCHCVQLENCVYGYNERLMQWLAREGRFGTLTHAEAAYIHDLRHLLLASHSEGLWRREPHKTRDGNFYPTHGLGPVALCLGIGTTDRFVRLISMSSQEASLSEGRTQILESGDERLKETYRAGDMNTSLLQTARGRTVMLQHDVVTPRPYSRGTLLQGSKGAFRDFPAGVWFDDPKVSQHTEEWSPLESVTGEFKDPLWDEAGETALKLGGHGGMDYLMTYQLVRCLREGLPPDMDVYDAAIWSAPGPLSELSVAQGNAPVDFPDFLSGNP
jgi:hypothetical protein